MKTERFDLPGTIVISEPDGRTRISPQFFADLTREKCEGSQVLLRALRQKLKEQEQKEQPELSL